MDFRPTEQQQLLRRAVREFAETEIRPHVREWDDAQHFPARAGAEAGGARPDGHPVPRGVRRGRRCPPSTTASASRSWRASTRRSRSRSPRTTACARRTSAMFGTEAQKQRYLVPLATGEWIGAWGLTEPTAGSDAARHADDGGARRRRLGAQRHEDVHHARQRRRRDGGDGGHRPGARRTAASRRSSSSGARRACRRAGRKTSSACARATRARCSSATAACPPTQLLGDEDEGFINTLQVLDAGRIGIAALAVGLAQGAYEAARRYALERTQFGQPIAVVPGDPVEAGRHWPRASRRRGC